MHASELLCIVCNLPALPCPALNVSWLQLWLSAVCGGVHAAAFHQHAGVGCSEAAQEIALTAGEGAAACGVAQKQSACCICTIWYRYLYLRLWNVA